MPCGWRLLELEHAAAAEVVRIAGWQYCQASIVRFAVEPFAIAYMSSRKSVSDVVAAA